MRNMGRMYLGFFLAAVLAIPAFAQVGDRKSTRLNSSHTVISYAVFCLKKKKNSHSPHMAFEIRLPVRLLLVAILQRSVLSLACGMWPASKNDIGECTQHIPSIVVA